ncbi:MAG: type II toxin-antitoxin system HicB family antitoxin [Rhodospirillales bacterium]
MDNCAIIAPAMKPARTAIKKRGKSITAENLGYKVVFDWSKADGVYHVTCPALPPVVTYGRTYGEARAMAAEAIELCLEVMRERGEPVPKPDMPKRRPGRRMLLSSSPLP